ncbi:hypothetical protein AVEN_178665-1 [Araneus ventricosus]|uniref:Uncharacterized protein n=1 Tax=Araneus ventricosus TaxID=182803 RepID=A0A4Y2I9Y2_ARAVE|nr:hypothetical protein AVEN_178665-1 [Araneus ventricosus]
MVSFDRCFAPDGVPWLTAICCPSGIVLDRRRTLSSVKRYVTHCSDAQLRCSRVPASGPPFMQCSIQFGGIWAFLQQQRAATPAVALVSSGVWHCNGSDRLPLW